MCAVLLVCCSNGADALKKYQGDKDIVEAAMEAGQILQQLQDTVSTPSFGMRSLTDALPHLACIAASQH
jgi:hypothetical protein